MNLEEKSITCFDCGNTFIFTIEEQEAFHSKGYTNSPKRCPACRQARKARQIRSGNYKSIQPGFYSERKLFNATCVQCGKSTQVPFEPTAGRPVYCRDCYGTAKVNK